MTQLKYQKHSETSKQAAQKNTKAGSMREKCFKLIEKSEGSGMISDEIAHVLIEPPNMIASRLGELEAQKRIIKLKETRKTRKNCDANVYVLPEYTRDRLTLEPKRPTDSASLKKENEKLRKALTFIANSKPWYIEKSSYSIIEIAKKALGGIEK